MSETAGLVLLIFMLAFFIFPCVCMLFSFIKDKDTISFILTVFYCLATLFLAHVLFSELVRR